MQKQLTLDDYKNLAQWLNNVLRKYNYRIAKKAPYGTKGSQIPTMWEYTLHLINIANDTTKKLIINLETILKNAPNRLEEPMEIKNVLFNRISPNSNKFPGFTFNYYGNAIDLVIAKGANAGEIFEAKTIANLASLFKRSSKKDPEYVKLIEDLNNANSDFASREIKSAKKRVGSTVRFDVPLENLGSVIGDIVLTDTTNAQWFISLKDIRGSTFGTSMATSLFNSAGDLQEKSIVAKTLKSFGVDLNKVQEGFDLRNNKNKKRKNISVKKANTSEIKSIFERAWGMNYFYVRKLTIGWKVFWIDRAYLNKLTSNIQVTNITYPNKNTKQVTIKCKNEQEEYIIETRNSSGGEYPNSIKFKLRK